ncbi:cupin domain-containing protein [Variovorax paradoxus]|nr:cupin domain-containing protein [Variovorax paradoxus]
MGTGGLASGTIRYRYGHETIDLHAGDSMLFEARTAHGEEAVGNAPASCISICFQCPSDPSFESFENGAVSHSEVPYGLCEPQPDARVRSQRVWQRHDRAAWRMCI